jgi:O-antigen/teichoic acid export membrane protein
VLIGSVSTIVFKLYAPAGHYERYVYAIVARRVVDVAAVAAAVMLGYGLSGTALLSALLWLVVAVPQLFALSRSYPEFFPWWRTGTLRTGIENLSRSISFTGVSMLEGLALHGTVLVIGAQLDAASVTVLLTQRTVANVFQQASTFVLQPLLADFGRFRAQGEWSKLSESFAAYWAVACFCVHAGMLVLLPMVSLLYTTWTRGRSTWEPAVFAGLAVGVIFRMVGAPATSYSLAVNDLRSQAFASASRAVVSLLGALLLTKPFGLVGATAAIAVSEVIGGCLVPGYAVWLRFVDAGARFPLRSLATTLTATGCTCLALFVYVYRPSLTVAVNGAAFAAISGILVVQFRSLGIETSTRIRGLLPRWRRS